MSKIKKTKDVDKKTIVKQVLFDELEWNIVAEAMRKDKIDNVSIFLRRAVLLYVGRYIQQQIKF